MSTNVSYTDMWQKNLEKDERVCVCGRDAGPKLLHRFILQKSRAQGPYTKLRFKTKTIRFLWLETLKHSRLNTNFKYLLLMFPSRAISILSEQWFSTRKDPGPGEGLTTSGDHWGAAVLLGARARVLQNTTLGCYWPATELLGPHPGHKATCHTAPFLGPRWSCICFLFLVMMG